MTDNTENTNSAPVASPKENPLAKLAGGFSWWINSLMGKSQAKVPTQTPEPQVPTTAEPQAPSIPKSAPPTAETPQAPSQTPASISGGAVNIEKPLAKAEDPIFQDLQKVKSLLGVVSGKVGERVKPAITKGAESTKDAASAYVKTVDKGFIKKALRIFLILILLIALIYIGLKFFRNMSSQTPGGTVNLTPANDQSPSPTLIIINPSNPSVYANDPAILKLEEDIRVLVREVDGSEIRENSLNPPRLNFNVTF